MRLTVDTDVIVRLAVQDHPSQAKTAEAIFRNATVVAIPIIALCEFVWVMRQGYKRTRPEIAASLRSLIEVGNVEVDRIAVEAGLAMLDSGGDFADGVIAFDGRCFGAETFVTFDREAATLIHRTGQAVHLLPS